MLRDAWNRKQTAETDLARGTGGLPGPQRERGLWSFLTWSFFLSQLAVGNAFAAGAAQAGNSLDLNSAVTGTNPGAADARITGVPDLGMLDARESQPAGPAAPGQSHGPAAAAVASMPAGLESLDLTSDAGSLAIQRAASHGAEMSEDAPTDATEANTGGLPSDAIPGIIPALEIDVPPLGTIEDTIDVVGSTLEDILVPVVETVEDLAGVLGPTLDQVLAPAETLVDGVVGGLQPTLDPLLSPVASLAEGVSEIIEPVGGIAAEIVALADPVIDAVEPILSPIVDVLDAAQPILDPVLDVVAPALELIEPVAEPLLQPLAPVLEPVLQILPLDIGGGIDLGGGDDAVASPGVIELISEAVHEAHEIFEAGAYTELGITLHEVLPLDPAAGGPIENVVDEVVSLVGDVEDAAGKLPSLLDNLHQEFALRGLGEGLI